eukprot:c28860_g1_i1 orf=2-220(-)
MSMQLHPCSHVKISHRLDLRLSLMPLFMSHADDVEPSLARLQPSHNAEIPEIQPPNHAHIGPDMPQIIGLKKL